MNGKILAAVVLACICGCGSQQGQQQQPLPENVERKLDVLHNRVLDALARQDQDLAIALADDALRLVQPDSREEAAWLALRGSCNSVRRPQQAIADYTAAIKRDASVPGYWTGRASAYIQAGRRQDARRDFLEAVRLDPRLKDREDEFR